jgi:hypothetical protein
MIFNSGKHFPSFCIAKLNLDIGTTGQELVNDIGYNKLMGTGAGSQTQCAMRLCLAELQDLMFLFQLIIHPLSG